MLQLVVAEEHQPLVDRLAERLTAPLADPFAREIVVVPNTGTAQWLRRRLAHRLGRSSPDRSDGVAANLAFHFPGHLVRQLAGQEQDPWEVDRLTWAVLEVLSRSLPDELAEAGATARTARRVADRFDTYATHRPGMVLHWSKNRDVDGVGEPLPRSQRWQPKVWRAVRSLIGVPSLPERLLTLTDRLKGGETGVDLPQRISVYGVAGIPPTHLDVLDALADRVDTAIFVPTPSVALFREVGDALRRQDLVPLRPRSDDPTAALARHPLLVSWASSQREGAVVFVSHPTRSKIDLVDPAGDAAASHPGPPVLSALARIQAAIRANQAPAGVPPTGAEDRRAVLAEDDRSLQVHACYGRARQAEVLRDAILHLLADHPDLEPRDVTILCPDVAGFAPHLAAAFASVPEGSERALRFRVADRSLRSDNPVAAAVLGILELVNGRFRASDVLDLLAQPPIQRALGLSEAAAQRAAEWVDDLEIRWGLDGPSRARFGLPVELEAHTWQAGLDRLLLGVAMADDELRKGPGGVVPYGDVEGDDVDTAGRLAELLRLLRGAAEVLTTAQPVADWCRNLAAATASLVAPGHDETWQLRDVDEALRELAAEAVVAGRSSQIPVQPRDFMDLLAGRLQGRQTRTSRDDGAILVGSPGGLRGVPSRVVCILGLDAADLPAAVAPADDLIAASPCIGDRDARSELRAELLDAVLAAGDHLVVTYTGRDLATNKEIPPAVPLAELLDVVDATFRPPHPDARASRAIVVEHPRQAYSVKNLRPGVLGHPGAWSFDAASLQAAHARAERRQERLLLDEPLPEPAPAHELRLEELLEVVENPTRFFLRRRLGVYLPRDGDPRDDLIPVELSPLDRWKVVNALIRAEIAGEDQFRLLEFMRAKGELPPGPLADGAVDRCMEELASIRETATAQGVHLARGDQEQIEVVTPHGLLTGTVDGVQHNRQVVITPSKLKPKDLLKAWVRLTALTYARPEVDWEIVLIGMRHSIHRIGPDVVLRFEGCTDDRARTAKRVLDLVAGMRSKALREPLPFHPATSRALLKGEDANGQWRNVNRPYEGDAGDAYRRLLYGSVDLEELPREDPAPGELPPCGEPVEDRLAAWAHTVWCTFDHTCSMPARDQP